MQQTDVELGKVTRFYLTERSWDLSSIYEMTLQAPFGGQTKTIKAALELFRKLLISQKACRDKNLEKVLCNVLTNTPVYYWYCRKTPFL